MNEKMIFGQYYNTSSLIHRLDPRTKFISLFILMITIFLISNIYALASFLGIVFTLIIISRIPIIKFLQSFKMMAMLLIFTIFFQIIFNRTGEILVTINFSLTYLNASLITILFVGFILLGKITKKLRYLTFLILIVASFYLQTINTLTNITPIIANYQISIYEGGTTTAMRVLFRIINLICLSSLLTLTTKPTDLNNGLESVTRPLKYVKINVSILAMMISIALRFIPTLINEATRILKAQASRGVDFKEGKFHDKIVQIVSLLIPMFVIAYKRAEDLANAMEARGYIPGAERSKINELKYHIRDWTSYALVVLILVVVIVGKVSYGL